VSEVERIATELERTVDELGADTWGQDREWCLDRLAEFYDGGIEAFGPAGPAPELLRAAHLWFLLDCPLPAGETPLWRARTERSERAIELLARSELRAWQIESRSTFGPLLARCPLGTSRARLELPSEPAGPLCADAFVVARSVPLSPGRWLLLGAAPVVGPPFSGDFARLVASLDAPAGAFWHVHGGVLARAAWEWPGRELRAAA
jgi:hypothetical protein